MFVRWKITSNKNEKKAAMYKRIGNLKRKNIQNTKYVGNKNILVWHWQRVAAKEQVMRPVSCRCDVIENPFILYFKEKETLFSFPFSFENFRCEGWQKTSWKKGKSLLFFCFWSFLKEFESQMTYGQVPDLERENCSESGRMLRVWPSKSSGQIPVVVVGIASVIIIECVTPGDVTWLFKIADEGDDFQPPAKWPPSAWVWCVTDSDELESHLTIIVSQVGRDYFIGKPQKSIKKFTH